MTRYNYCIGVATAGAGTITVTAGSSDVNGSGTAFNSFFQAGDYIMAGTVIKPINALDTNTHLTIIGTWPANQSNTIYSRIRLINIESLTPSVYPPRSTFRSWTMTVPTGDGLERGLGRPQATWRWGFITAAQRDILRTYITSKSARVYIRTRRTENNDDYEEYSAAALWPDDEDRLAGRRLNFVLEFRDLVAF